MKPTNQPTLGRSIAKAFADTASQTLSVEECGQMLTFLKEGPRTSPPDSQRQQLQNEVNDILHKFYKEEAEAILTIEHAKTQHV